MNAPTALHGGHKATMRTKPLWVAFFVVLVRFVFIGSSAVGLLQ